MYAWEAAGYVQSSLQLPIQWTAKGCANLSGSTSYLGWHVQSTLERQQSTTATGRMMKVFHMRVGPKISLQTGRQLQHPINLFKALCCAMANVAVLHLQSASCSGRTCAVAQCLELARTLAEPCNQACHLNHQSILQSSKVLRVMRALARAAVASVKPFTPSRSPSDLSCLAYQ